MQSDRELGQFEFAGFEHRRVVARIAGGAMTSDAGALLLWHADRAIGLLDQVAKCFIDHRTRDCVVRSVRAMVGDSGSPG